MKKFMIGIYMLVFLSTLILNPIFCNAGIPAPEGKIWATADGSTFKNGESTITTIPGGYYIECSDDTRCCWEITDNGKNLEVYTNVIAPKPGPIEPSESTIIAVPDELSQ